MAGAGRPKKRDEHIGEDPALALNDYLVRPDFQVVPKSPWSKMVPGIQDRVQDESYRLRDQFPNNKDAVLDYLNNESSYDSELQNIRDLEIESAVKQGRVAQMLGANRNPASTVGGTQVPIDPKRPMWNKQPLLNGGQNLADETQRTNYFKDFGWEDDSPESFWYRNKLEDIRAEERKRLKLKK
jgi:hypothetical protein